MPTSSLATWFPSTTNVTYGGKKGVKGSKGVKGGAFGFRVDISGKKAITVSSDGTTMLYSTNSGETWTQSDFPSDSSVYQDLFSITDDYAITVGKNNTTNLYSVYYSTNGGQNWTVSDLINRSSEFNNLAISSNLSGYYAIVTDNFPSIYYSYSDGTQSVGQNWTVVGLRGPRTYTNLSMSGLNAIVSVYLPDNNYTIYYSQDGGQNWNFNSDFPLTSDNIRLLSISGENAIVVRGPLNNSTILYSNNLQNWLTSGFTITDSTYQLSTSGENAIIIGFNNSTRTGVIYNSSDGGTNWTRVLNLENIGFSSCSMSDKYAIAVGGNIDGTVGIIYYSEDFGKTWSPTTIAGDNNIIFNSCSLSGENAISKNANYFLFYSKSSVSPIVCYVKGTLIFTENGWKPIEEIKKGTKVLTKGKIQNFEHVNIHAKPKLASVLWSSKFKVAALNDKSYPICIKKDALGKNVPFKDLYVSPKHGLLINGKRVFAKELINETTIYQDKTWEDVEYYHLECSKHCAIFANGVLSESYLNKKSRFVFENKIAPRRNKAIKKAK